MSWDAEVQELQRRRYLAQQQGGEAALPSQHARGRMTIRERIGVLLDEGSFREHGRATASPVYDDNDELIEYVPAITLSVSEPSKGVALLSAAKTSL
jgi:acetyl-CoA carboxylase carboxyltransferase component